MPPLRTLPQFALLTLIMLSLVLVGWHFAEVRNAQAAKPHPSALSASKAGHRTPGLPPPAALLTPTGTMVTANDGVAGDAFGGSVAMSGNTAVVGAPNDDIGPNEDQGSAYIFVRNGATWTQQAKLMANDGAASDLFGFSVAINGDTVIVSASNDNVGTNADQGSAYIFVRNGATWTQQAKLTANDGAASDFFGQSVAISGETVVVGAPGDDAGANANQGSAYVFVRSGTTWTQQAKLTSNDGAAFDLFGGSVALSGDTALVGAPNNAIGASFEQGSAYIFVRSGTTWTQQTMLIASDGNGGDLFGFSVALHGETALVSAPSDDIDGSTDHGSAYVFVRIGTTWAQQAKLTASDGLFNDNFGFAVSLSGNTALIGVPADDTGQNEDQGSAYIFVRSGTTWTQQAKLTASDGLLIDRFGWAVAVSGDRVLVGVPFDSVEGKLFQGSAHFFDLGLCPAITVDPPSFPSATAGSSYRQNIFPTDGSFPVTVGVTGALPPGLSFVQFTGFGGLLAGTPTQGGSFPITVRITDANGCFGERSYTLVVNCPATFTLNPSLLPAGAIGATYNQPLVAACGTAPINFSVSAGALPNGLTLSAGGVLSGTPTTIGLSIFTIKAMDATGQTATRSYTLPIYQEQMATSSDGGDNDQFGWSVAISGDTAIVGAPSDDIGANENQGSVYVYVRNGTSWTQQAKLTASDGAAGIIFGSSVAISGDTAIVGAFGANNFQGAAYVYVRSRTSWTQQAKLTASDGAADDSFGDSVAISGETAIVGAPFDGIGANENQGSAYVYVRSGTSWAQQAKLTASDGAASDTFGRSVSLSGETAIVGAPDDDIGANEGQGSAYVYVRNGTSWTEQAKLTMNDGAASDFFGQSVAISGNTALVGAPFDDVTTNFAQGSACTFVRNGTSWTQQTKLIASDGSTFDLFGFSVAVSGSNALVGAPFDKVGANGFQGSAHFFDLNLCPALTIDPATLPSATAGSGYNQSFTATGSEGQITFSLTGALPTGLSFVQVETFADPKLFGTPTQSGSFPITVRATDANGCFGERSYTLVVNCPATLTISPPVLPAGAVGAAYNQILAASCGTAPINFTVSAGTLPNGLTLSASGMLSGTPTAIGLSIFTVQATTANGQTTTRSYTLPIYQKQMVTASDGVAGDSFGSSVAISGETAIVGSPNDDIGANSNQGSAYIYVRQGATWTQQAMLTASDGAANNLFGQSVAISGDTAIVGAFGATVGANTAQGAAYVYVRSGTNWTQQAKLTASDGATFDLLGWSVAISGDTALVSAPGGDAGANENQGSAYTFVRNGTSWTQQAKLTASDGATADGFGWSVALSGNTALVGAVGDTVGANKDQGSAYVFVRQGTTWTQQTKLTSSDGVAEDAFGIAVALSGETALIGAVGGDVGGNKDQGAAYVFVRNGTTWTQQAKLTSSDGVAGDFFGWSGALSGNTAIVGAQRDNVGANAEQGSAAIFVRNGTSWTQQTQLTANDGAPADGFGSSVGLSGNLVVVGAPGDDVGANKDQGSAHFFDLSAPTCPALTINPATLPSGTVGAAYNQSLTATGGTPAYNFSVTAGTLPGGITLSTGGALSGTPTASGTFNLTVKAKDANNCEGTQSYTLTIAAPANCIPVSISTSLSGATGSTITVPILTGDLTGKGISAYDFTLTFDPAVVKPSSTPIDSIGTLSSGFTVTPNTTTPGRITVSAFGSGTLTGAGTLLNLKLDLIGAASACSNLTWLNFVFNEGLPCAMTTNGQVCIGGGAISGTVTYATATTTLPVPGVLLTAAGTPSATATTSNTGSYNLTGLGSGPYTVTPSKTGQVNGISSFDASLVARAVSGLVTLTAAQQIAADASNNGSVSSFDASLISQTAAGIANSGIGGTWKFIPANRSYPTLSGNQTEQNFSAVLVGDVSGNWTPPAGGLAPDAETATHSIKTVADTANPIIVSLPQVTGVPDSVVTLPIKVGDLTDRGVVAYDFTINYDPAVLQPLGAATDAAGTLSTDFQITANTATPGCLTVSAFGAQALAGEGTLLHLKFKVVGEAGAATALTWPDFVFNESAPGAAPATGSFAVEISGRGINVHANVSAASFRAGDLASEQIVSAFGVNLAARTEAAATLPLPTELAGTRVEITDSLGVKRTAPLYFVSPQQINYQIPAETAEGAATVMILRDGQLISTGLINITAVAPALFTVNASGAGLPAAMVLRVDASGAQSYEAIARFDATTNRFVPIPIKLGAESDQVFLILYGTGMRGRSGLDAVNCAIGGEESETLYAGAAPGLVGVDQINIRLPQSLRGRGEVPLTVTVNGRVANTVMVKIE